MTEEEKTKERELLFERVKKAAEELQPFFDSVHIFVNVHENNKTGTVRIDYGLGNWFARYGQVSWWVDNQQEIEEDTAEE
jgi:hypothetical protein